MSHRRFSHPFRRAPLTTRGVRPRAAVAILTTLASPTALAAQQPPPTPYRSPTIALVHPAHTGTVPRDRPVIVFRFAPGESDDPIDARSFAVTVDGVDRSARFQVASHEAWGSMAGAPETDATLDTGPHAVAARICSVRGSCATTAATVIVDAGATAKSDAPPDKKPLSPRAQLLARVIDIVGRILFP